MNPLDALASVSGNLGTVNLPVTPVTTALPGAPVSEGFGSLLGGLQTGGAPGAMPASAEPTASSGAATVTSPRSRSIARATASATADGRRVPSTRGSGIPVSAYMPDSLTKPGSTIETPTPLPASSARSDSAKPRRPNFVAQ